VQPALIAGTQAKSLGAAGQWAFPSGALGHLQPGDALWSQPADVVLAQAAEGLVMPRLGEPVEPARVEAVEPWWRGRSEGDWQDAAQQEAGPLVLPVKD